MLNTSRIEWTKHAEYKMRYYRLSESRVKRVLRNPLRTEEGVAEDTIAMLQAVTTSKNPYEIWVMVSKSGVSAKGGSASGGKGKGSVVRVISAWRYPGRTKVGEKLPNHIIEEINEVIK